jgi:hypothetical protein
MPGPHASGKSSRRQNDGLHDRHGFQRVPSAQPSKTAFLPGAAAKRKMQFPIAGRFVDVDDAGWQGLAEPHCAREILCED